MECPFGHKETVRDCHTTHYDKAVAEVVKSFLSNYVDENAVLLPGRILGYQNEDIKLLSSCDTKMSVWKTFKRACEDSNNEL